MRPDIEKMIEAAARGYCKYEGIAADKKVDGCDRVLWQYYIDDAKAYLRAALKELPDNKKRLPNHELQALVRDGQIYQQLKEWAEQNDNIS